MIISHKYKYLFIETPHTGSTAISKELQENYDGQPILHKHAYYFEFARQASEKDRTAPRTVAERKKYFVFAGIRNPLDEALSTYLKYYNNHKSNYTNPQQLIENGGWVTNGMLRKFHFVQDKKNTFKDYLYNFYKIPYTNSININSKYCDFIIRFETLNEDFSQVLKLLHIPQVRPLPRVNRTENKDKKHYKNFFPADSYSHAVKIFGPFMQEWNYRAADRSFPASWNDLTPSHSDVLKYNMLKKMRLIYVKYGKYGFLRKATRIRNLIE